METESSITYMFDFHETTIIYVAFNVTLNLLLPPIFNNNTHLHMIDNFIKEITFLINLKNFKVL